MFDTETWIEERDSPCLSRHLAVWLVPVFILNSNFACLGIIYGLESNMEGWFYIQKYATTMNNAFGTRPCDNSSRTGLC